MIYHGFLEPSQVHQQYVKGKGGFKRLRCFFGASGVSVLGVMEFVPTTGGKISVNKKSPQS